MRFAKWRYGLGGYLAGSTAARTGDEAAGPALVLLGLAATGSAGTASAVLAALTAATGIGGPLFGALLDRRARPGRLLGAALVGYALGLAALAATVGRTPLVVPVLLAAGTGLLGPALAAGWTSRLAGLVPADRMDRAYALDATAYTVAGLLGPALAGLLAATIGAAPAVLLAAVLPAVATPIALRLPPTAARPAPAAPAPPVSAPSVPVRSTPAPSVTAASAPAASAPAVLSASGSSVGLVGGLVADLAAGLRVLVGRPALLRVTVVSGLSYLGLGAFTVAVPQVMAELTGYRSWGPSLLVVVAVGSAMATAVLARRPLRVSAEGQVVAGAMVLAGGLGMVALAGVVRAVPVAVVGALVVGLADGPQLAAVFVVRHREAPAGLRSQVFTTGASVKLGAFALGAALAGPLLGRSPAGGLVLAVGAGLAGGVVGIFLGMRRFIGMVGK